jgi:uncharacterized protein with PIN domain
MIIITVFVTINQRINVIQNIIITRDYIFYRILGRERARCLYIKTSKFVKNEHARYTVEYVLVDNARVIYTEGLNS